MIGSTEIVVLVVAILSASSALIMLNISPGSLHVLSIPADNSNNIFVQSQGTILEDDMNSADYTDVETENIIQINENDFKTPEDNIESIKPQTSYYKDFKICTVLNNRDSNLNTNSNGFVPINKVNHFYIKLQPDRWIGRSFDKNGNNGSEIIANNKHLNRNATIVYVAGPSKDILNLKEEIHRHGEGHELLVYFYFFKDLNYYYYGHLFTDSNILRDCISKCHTLFCMDMFKNDWCFANLINSDKNYVNLVGTVTFTQPQQSHNNVKLVEHMPHEHNVDFDNNNIFSKKKDDSSNLFTSGTNFLLSKESGLQGNNIIVGLGEKDFEINDTKMDSYLNNDDVMNSINVKTDNESDIMNKQNSILKVKSNKLVTGTSTNLNNALPFHTHLIQNHDAYLLSKDNINYDNEQNKSELRNLMGNQHDVIVNKKSYNINETNEDFLINGNEKQSSLKSMDLKQYNQNFKEKEQSLKDLGNVAAPMNSLTNINSNKDGITYQYPSSLIEEDISSTVVNYESDADSINKFEIIGQDVKNKKNNDIPTKYTSAYDINLPLQNEMHKNFTIVAVYPNDEASNTENIKTKTGSYDYTKTNSNLKYISTINIDQNLREIPKMTNYTYLNSFPTQTSYFTESMPYDNSYLSKYLPKSKSPLTPPFAKDGKSYSMPKIITQTELDNNPISFDIGKNNFGDAVLGRSKGNQILTPFPTQTSYLTESMPYDNSYLAKYLPKSKSPLTPPLAEDGKSYSMPKIITQTELDNNRISFDIGKNNFGDAVLGRSKGNQIITPFPTQTSYFLESMPHDTPSLSKYVPQSKSSLTPPYADGGNSYFNPKIVTGAGLNDNALSFDIERNNIAKAALDRTNGNLILAPIPTQTSGFPQTMPHGTSYFSKYMPKSKSSLTAPLTEGGKSYSMPKIITQTELDNNPISFDIGKNNFGDAVLGRSKGNQILTPFPTQTSYFTESMPYDNSYLAKYLPKSKSPLTPPLAEDGKSYSMPKIITQTELDNNPITFDIGKNNFGDAVLGRSKEKQILRPFPTQTSYFTESMPYDNSYLSKYLPKSKSPLTPPLAKDGKSYSMPKIITQTELDNNRISFDIGKNNFGDAVLGRSKGNQILTPFPTQTSYVTESMPYDNSYLAKYLPKSKSPLTPPLAEDGKSYSMPKIITQTELDNNRISFDIGKNNFGDAVLGRSKGNQIITPFPTQTSYFLESMPHDTPSLSKYVPQSKSSLTPPYADGGNSYFNPKIVTGAGLNDNALSFDIERNNIAKAALDRTNGNLILAPIPTQTSGFPQTMPHGTSYFSKYMPKSKSSLTAPLTEDGKSYSMPKIITQTELDNNPISFDIGKNNFGDAVLGRSKGNQILTPFPTQTSYLTESMPYDNSYLAKYLPKSKSPLTPPLAEDGKSYSMPKIITQTELDNNRISFDIGKNNFGDAVLGRSKGNQIITPFPTQTSYFLESMPHDTPSLSKYVPQSKSSLTPPYADGGNSYFNPKIVTGAGLNDNALSFDIERNNIAKAALDRTNGNLILAPIPTQTSGFPESLPHDTPCLSKYLPKSKSPLTPPLAEDGKSYSMPKIITQTELDNNPVSFDIERNNIAKAALDRTNGNLILAPIPTQTSGFPESLPHDTPCLSKYLPKSKSSLTPPYADGGNSYFNPKIVTGAGLNDNALSFDIERNNIAKAALDRTNGNLILAPIPTQTSGFPESLPHDTPCLSKYLPKSKSPLTPPLAEDGKSYSMPKIITQTELDNNRISFDIGKNNFGDAVLGRSKGNQIITPFPTQTSYFLESMPHDTPCLSKYVPQSKSSLTPPYADGGNSYFNPKIVTGAGLNDNALSFDIERNNIAKAALDRTNGNLILAPIPTQTSGFPQTMPHGTSYFSKYMPKSKSSLTAPLTEGGKSYSMPKIITQTELDNNPISFDIGKNNFGDAVLGRSQGNQILTPFPTQTSYFTESMPYGYLYIAKYLPKSKSPLTPPLAKDGKSYSMPKIITQTELDNNRISFDIGKNNFGDAVLGRSKGNQIITPFPTQTSYFLESMPHDTPCLSKYVPQSKSSLTPPYADGGNSYFNPKIVTGAGLNDNALSFDIERNNLAKAALDRTNGNLILAPIPTQTSGFPQTMPHGTSYLSKYMPKSKSSLTAPLTEGGKSYSMPKIITQTELDNNRISFDIGKNNFGDAVLGRSQGNQILTPFPTQTSYFTESMPYGNSYIAKYLPKSKSPLTPPLAKDGKSYSMPKIITQTELDNNPISFDIGKNNFGDAFLGRSKGNQIITPFPTQTSYFLESMPHDTPCLSKYVPQSKSSLTPPYADGGNSYFNPKIVTGAGLNDNALSFDIERNNLAKAALDRTNGNLILAPIPTQTSGFPQTMPHGTSYLSKYMPKSKSSLTAPLTEGGKSYSMPKIITQTELDNNPISFDIGKNNFGDAVLGRSQGNQILTPFPTQTSYFTESMPYGNSYIAKYLPKSKSPLTPPLAKDGKSYSMPKIITQTELDNNPISFDIGKNNFGDAFLGRSKGNQIITPFPTQTSYFLESMPHDTPCLSKYVPQSKSSLTPPYADGGNSYFNPKIVTGAGLNDNALSFDIERNNIAKAALDRTNVNLILAPIPTQTSGFPQTMPHGTSYLSKYMPKSKSSLTAPLTEGGKSYSIPKIITQTELDNNRISFDIGTNNFGDAVLGRSQGNQILTPFPTQTSYFTESMPYGNSYLAKYLPKSKSPLTPPLAEDGKSYSMPKIITQTELDNNPISFDIGKNIFGDAVLGRSKGNQILRPFPTQTSYFTESMPYDNSYLSKYLPKSKSPLPPPLAKDAKSYSMPKIITQTELDNNRISFDIGKNNFGDAVLGRSKGNQIITPFPTQTSYFLESMPHDTPCLSKYLPQSKSSLTPPYADGGNSYFNPKIVTGAGLNDNALSFDIERNNLAKAALDRTNGNLILAPIPTQTSGFPQTMPHGTSYLSKYMPKSKSSLTAPLTEGGKSYSMPKIITQTELDNNPISFDIGKNNFGDAVLGRSQGNQILTPFPTQTSYFTESMPYGNSYIAKYLPKSKSPLTPPLAKDGKSYSMPKIITQTELDNNPISFDIGKNNFGDAFLGRSKGNQIITPFPTQTSYFLESMPHDTPCLSKYVPQSKSSLTPPYADGGNSYFNPKIVTGAGLNDNALSFDIERNNIAKAALDRTNVNLILAPIPTQTSGFPQTMPHGTSYLSKYMPKSKSSLTAPLTEGGKSYSIPKIITQTELDNNRISFDIGTNNFGDAVLGRSQGNQILTPFPTQTSYFTESMPYGNSYLAKYLPKSKSPLTPPLAEDGKSYSMPKIITQTELDNNPISFDIGKNIFGDAVLGRSKGNQILRPFPTQTSYFTESMPYDNSYLSKYLPKSKSPLPPPLAKDGKSYSMPKIITQTELDNNPISFDIGKNNIGDAVLGRSKGNQIVTPFPTQTSYVTESMAYDNSYLAKYLPKSKSPLTPPLAEDGKSYSMPKIITQTELDNNRISFDIGKNNFGDAVLGRSKGNQIITPFPTQTSYFLESMPHNTPCLSKYVPQSKSSLTPPYVDGGNSYFNPKIVTGAGLNDNALSFDIERNNLAKAALDRTNGNLILAPIPTQTSGFPQTMPHGTSYLSKYMPKSKSSLTAPLTEGGKSYSIPKIITQTELDNNPISFDIGKNNFGDAVLGRSQGNQILTPFPTQTSYFTESMPYGNSYIAKYLPKSKSPLKPPLAKDGKSYSMPKIITQTELDNNRISFDIGKNNFGDAVLGRSKGNQILTPFPTQTSYVTESMPYDTPCLSKYVPQSKSSLTPPYADGGNSYFNPKIVTGAGLNDNALSFDIERNNIAKAALDRTNGNLILAPIPTQTSGFPESLPHDTPCLSKYLPKSKSPLTPPLAEDGKSYSMPKIITQTELDNNPVSFDIGKNNFGDAVLGRSKGNQILTPFPTQTSYVTESMPYDTPCLSKYVPQSKSSLTPPYADGGNSYFNPKIVTGAGLNDNALSFDIERNNIAKAALDRTNGNLILAPIPTQTSGFPQTMPHGTSYLSKYMPKSKSSLTAPLAEDGKSYSMPKIITQTELDNNPISFDIGKNNFGDAVPGRSKGNQILRPFPTQTSYFTESMPYGNSYLAKYLPKSKSPLTPPLAEDSKSYSMPKIITQTELDNNPISFDIGKNIFGDAVLGRSKGNQILRPFPTQTSYFTESMPYDNSYLAKYLPKSKSPLTPPLAEYGKSYSMPKIITQTELDNNPIIFDIGKNNFGDAVLGRSKGNQIITPFPTQTSYLTESMPYDYSYLAKYLPKSKSPLRPPLAKDGKSYSMPKLITQTELDNNPISFDICKNNLDDAVLGRSKGNQILTPFPTQTSYLTESMPYDNSYLPKYLPRSKSPLTPPLAEDGKSYSMPKIITQTELDNNPISFDIGKNNFGDAVLGRSKGNQLITPFPTQTSYFLESKPYDNSYLAQYLPKSKSPLTPPLAKDGKSYSMPKIITQTELDNNPISFDIGKNNFGDAVLGRSKGNQLITPFPTQTSYFLESKPYDNSYLAKYLPKSKSPLTPPLSKDGKSYSMPKIITQTELDNNPISVDTGKNNFGDAVLGRSKGNQILTPFPTQTSYLTLSMPYDYSYLAKYLPKSKSPLRPPLAKDGKSYSMPKLITQTELDNNPISFDICKNNLDDAVLGRSKGNQILTPFPTQTSYLTESMPYDNSYLPKYLPRSKSPLTPPLAEDGKSYSMPKIITQTELDNNPISFDIGKNNFGDAVLGRSKGNQLITPFPTQTSYFLESKPYDNSYLAKYLPKSKSPLTPPLAKDGKSYSMPKIITQTELDNNPISFDIGKNNFGDAVLGRSKGNQLITPFPTQTSYFLESKPYDNSYLAKYLPKSKSPLTPPLAKDGKSYSMPKIITQTELDNNPISVDTGKNNFGDAVLGRSKGNQILTPFPTQTSYFTESMPYDNSYLSKYLPKSKSPLTPPLAKDGKSYSMPKIITQTELDNNPISVDTGKNNFGDAVLGRCKGNQIITPFATQTSYFLESMPHDTPCLSKYVPQSKSSLTPPYSDGGNSYFNPKIVTGAGLNDNALSFDIERNNIAKAALDRTNGNLILAPIPTQTSGFPQTMPHGTSYLSKYMPKSKSSLTAPLTESGKSYSMPKIITQTELDNNPISFDIGTNNFGDAVLGRSQGNQIITPFPTQTSYFTESMSYGNSYLAKYLPKSKSPLTPPLAKDGKSYSMPKIITQTELDNNPISFDIGKNNFGDAVLGRSKGNQILTPFPTQTSYFTESMPYDNSYLSKYLPKSKSPLTPPLAKDGKSYSMPKIMTQTELDNNRISFDIGKNNFGDAVLGRSKGNQILTPFPTQTSYVTESMPYDNSYLAKYLPKSKSPLTPPLAEDGKSYSMPKIITQTELDNNRISFDIGKNNFGDAVLGRSKGNQIITPFPTQTSYFLESMPHDTKYVPQSKSSLTPPYADGGNSYFNPKIVTGAGLNDNALSFDIERNNIAKAALDRTNGNLILAPIPTQTSGFPQTIPHVISYLSKYLPKSKLSFKTPYAELFTNLRTTNTKAPDQLFSIPVTTFSSNLNIGAQSPWSLSTLSSNLNTKFPPQSSFTSDISSGQRSKMFYKPEKEISNNISYKTNTYRPQLFPPFIYGFDSYSNLESQPITPANFKISTPHSKLISPSLTPPFDKASTIVSSVMPPKEKAQSCCSNMQNINNIIPLFKQTIKPYNKKTAYNNLVTYSDPGSAQFMFDESNKNDNIDNSNPYSKTKNINNILENIKNKPLTTHTIAIAKYEPFIDDSFLVQTEDENIELKAWRSKLQIIKPRIVYDIDEVSTLNFMPIVKSCKYPAEKAANIAISFVIKKYGEAVVINGVYSYSQPYAIINDFNVNKIKNNVITIIWPTFCNCGCCNCGCQCLSNK